MGRPHRIDRAGAWYHVVNRGVDRCAIFADDRDRVEFGRLLGVAHERFGVTFHAYCLMTNHYHLVVECPDGRLSDAMHLVGAQYARTFNDRANRDGPLFRGRFFAREIGDDGDLVAVVRYVHRNPLAFVTPDALESYRWSSLRTYLRHRVAPPWMRLDVVDAVTGGEAGMRDLVLGSVPGLGAGHGPERWWHFAAVAVDEHVVQLSRHRADRTVLAYLLDHVDPVTERELTQILAFPNDRAASEARRRARQRASRQPAIALAAEAVLRAVS